MQARVRILDDPSTITNKHLKALYHKIFQPLHSSNHVKEDGYIFICEHVNDVTYVKLRLVPCDLRHDIFLEFYSNPLGGHYSVYYTFHQRWFILFLA